MYCLSDCGYGGVVRGDLDIEIMPRSWVLVRRFIQSVTIRPAFNLDAEMQASSRTGRFQCEDIEQT